MATTLTYTVSAYTPFTKILSANINQDKADIRSRLNWDGTANTGLGDDNIQSASVSGGGITPTTKLKSTGSSAGQFLASNGSAVVWASNPLTSQFNVVIGSAAQVTAGTATHSSYVTYSASAADGDRILVLPAYATNEAWSITKKLYIQGLGNTSIIQGAITIGTGGSYTIIKDLKTQADLTISSGVTGCFCTGISLSSSFTFVDNNSSQSNYLVGVQG